jgi:hypothetical protein
LRGILRIFSASVLSVIVALATAWAALALWYRLPAPEVGRALASLLFILLGLITIATLFGRLRFRALVLFAAVFGAVLLWWGTIPPLRVPIGRPTSSGKSLEPTTATC